jgi:hypothetical protein
MDALLPILDFCANVVIAILQLIAIFAASLVIFFILHYLGVFQEKKPPPQLSTAQLIASAIMLAFIGALAREVGVFDKDEDEDEDD